MTVYVVQESGHNFTKAEQYGPLEFLCRKEFPVFGNGREAHIDFVRSRLNNFNPTDDVLLLTGDPGNIGVCFALILDLGFRAFRVLKWDNQSQMYNVVTVEV